MQDKEQPSWYPQGHDDRVRSRGDGHEEGEVGQGQGELATFDPNFVVFSYSPLAQPSVGINVDRIISTRVAAKNYAEIDVQFISDILGAPIQNKRYIFGTNEEALKFQTHLDVMRASGAKLKQIFGELDKRNTGQITKYILQVRSCESLADTIKFVMSKLSRMLLTTFVSEGYEGEWNERGRRGGHYRGRKDDPLGR